MAEGEGNPQTACLFRLGLDPHLQPANPETGRTGDTLSTSRGHGKKGCAQGIGIFHQTKNWSHSPIKFEQVDSAPQPAS